MRILLASLLLSCTSPPTFEDTARVLIPDELYIERGFGIYDGPQAYEREDLTVGLSWGLMPREVRIVNTPPGVVRNPEGRDYANHPRGEPRVSHGDPYWRFRPTPHGRRGGPLPKAKAQ